MEVVFAAVVAALGTLVVLLWGQRFQRERDLREMRRIAYVEWLKTARTLARIDGSGQSSLMVPTPERQARLNDLTSELQIVASPGVVIAANAYLNRLQSKEFAQAMHGP